MRLTAKGDSGDGSDTIIHRQQSLRAGGAYREEAIAYETLYVAKGASLKRMAEMTAGVGLLPSHARWKRSLLALDSYSPTTLLRFFRTPSS